MRPILVSSCLLGLATRYDGKSKACPNVASYLAANRLIPIPFCPEQLAGLPTPRPKSWFTAGDGQAVLAGTGQLQSEAGEDVTAMFLRGAQMSLQLAQLTGCSAAILKERSPSCGCRKIHRNGSLVDGQGVTAALLSSQGVRVFSEEQIED